MSATAAIVLMGTPSEGCLLEYFSETVAVLSSVCSSVFTKNSRVQLNTQALLCPSITESNTGGLQTEEDMDEDFLDDIRLSIEWK